MSIQIDEIILVTICCLPFVMVALGCLGLIVSADKCGGSIPYRCALGCLGLIVSADVADDGEASERRFP
jgi:hypothetical protein